MLDKHLYAHWYVNKVLAAGCFCVLITHSGAYGIRRDEVLVNCGDWR